MRTLCVSVRCPSLPGSSACCFWLSVVGMSDSFIRDCWAYTDEFLCTSSHICMVYNVKRTCTASGLNLVASPAPTSKPRNFVVFRPVLMGSVASAVVSVPFRTPGTSCIHSTIGCHPSHLCRVSHLQHTTSGLYHYCHPGYRLAGACASLMNRSLSARMSRRKNKRYQPL